MLDDAEISRRIFFLEALLRSRCAVDGQLGMVGQDSL